MSTVTTPQRIQMRRDRPWKHEHPDSIRVDRATRWGNPFRAGEAVEITEVSTHAITERIVTVRDAAHAVDMFGWWLDGDIQIRWWKRPRPTDAQIQTLAGHPLACWCKPGEPCHADVLWDRANS